ncbi:MAG: hypothetical protein Q8Q49_00710 [bacterium]|nr:hypothetical protein [bacterium]
MAKHRKTRKEKIRSDIRQEHVIITSPEPIATKQETAPIRFTFSPSEQQKQAPVSHSSINTKSNDYAFVGHDLKKTGIVTTGIIIAELALFAVIT